MSVTPGHHKIQTSSGKYLTLFTQTGIVTAMPASGSNNQVWDFQFSGTNYTIKNTGFVANAYAYSNGQDAAPVTGNSLSTEWAVIPNNGVYSIQYAQDTSKACHVGNNEQVTLSVTQLTNPQQQFSIQ